MEITADIIETAEAPTLEEVLVMDDMPTDGIVIVDEPVIEEKEFDLEKNKDPKKFLSYIKKKLQTLPKHSGETTTGCERTIAYCKGLDRLISKMMAEDSNCDIDDLELEAVRKDLRKMVKKLEKRYNEINDAYDADDATYAAESTDALVKEADLRCKKCGVKVADRKAAKTHAETVHNGEDIAFSDYDESKKAEVNCECKIEKVAVPEDNNCPKCKIKLWKAAEGMYECIACDAVFEHTITKEAGTPRVQLVMSPFERAICGIITNGVVSQGKNAEDVYAELKKQYKFSDRDELSIQQLLTDLGYPVARNFMQVSKDNNDIEFSTNYQA